jgi:hypothetical protein
MGKLRMGGKHTTIIGKFGNSFISALDAVTKKQKLIVSYSPGLVKQISAKTNSIKFRVINPDVANVVISSRHGINHLHLSVNGCTIQQLAILVSDEMGITINIRDD